MLSKGKRMIRKKEKTTGCLLLVPLPGRQEPFASQAKNLPPVRGEHAYAVRVLRSIGAERRKTPEALKMLRVLHFCP